MFEVTIENYFSLVRCKGILPFVKTYATKCSSYYRDIVCSCLMEAEEARRNEVYREWFLSVYISYKSDQIRKKYFCRCSTLLLLK